MFEEISSLIATTKKAIDLLISAKDLLPEGKDKEEIESKVNAAQREIELAEAAVAKDLGYKLC